MNGIMLGERVLVTDEAGSKPIVETAAPEAPDGYEARYAWVDTGEAIEQSWSLAPVEGSAAEAAVELARIQAQGLSDADAARVPTLYDEWSGDGVEYAVGDRVRFQGNLVKCLQAHTSQAGWTPDTTRALWTPMGVSADDPEAVPEWVQPTGAHDAYAKGSHVMHGGVEWVSDLDANVWEPGVSGWTQVGGDAG